MKAFLQANIDIPYYMRIRGFWNPWKLEVAYHLLYRSTPPHENLYHGQASSSKKLKNKSKKSKWSRDISNYFGSQFVKKLNKTENLKNLPSAQTCPQKSNLGTFLSVANLLSRFAEGMKLQVQLSTAKQLMTSMLRHTLSPILECFPKVGTGRPDHGWSSHFDNEIAFSRAFLLKHHLLCALVFRFWLI